MMAAWGVATMVLAFAVVLLVFELYRRGASTEDTSPSVPVFAASHDAGADTRSREAEIHVYFASPYALELHAEPRLVELTSDTIENCKRAFAALAEGPRSDAVPVVDTGARARAMYLMPNGDLVVDLAREVDVPALHSASAELLAVQSIVLTLTQSGLRAGDTPPVRRVELLFEGSPLSERFPEHTAFQGAIEPKPSWAGAAMGSPGDV
jgi:hypothetical protein